MNFHSFLWEHETINARIVWFYMYSINENSMQMNQTGKQDSKCVVITSKTNSQDILQQLLSENKTILKLWINFPYLYSTLASDSSTQPWSTSSMLLIYLPNFSLLFWKAYWNHSWLPDLSPGCVPSPTCNTSAPLYLVTTIQPSHLIPSPIFCLNVRT